MRDRVELTVRDLDVDPAPDAEDSVFEFAGYRVRATGTVHSMPCLAYRFEGPDGDFTFSGDSEATDRLAAFADGSAVFVHDCSFPDAVDVSNHPTPAALGRTLAGNEYGEVYLTHLYPHTDGEHTAMLESLAEGFSGEVRFASDGRTVRVDGP
jgi:ribonuclease BN (tRNA processing enzyme)